MNILNGSKLSKMEDQSNFKGFEKGYGSSPSDEDETFINQRIENVKKKGSIIYNKDKEEIQ